MYTDAEALANLQRFSPKPFPKTMVILGSGWNEILNQADVIAEIAYADLFGITATVPGHHGKLVIAAIGGTEIAFMVGRIHMYEGYTAAEATLPLRVLNQAGANILIVTAAAGAINEKYAVGDLVVLNDMITLALSLMGPLTGPEFVDLSDAFDHKLIDIAKAALVKNHFPFHDGIYMYLHGPNYETPADKMACKILGADVVGMSTVPEIIQARALNMRVLGLSLVTNLAFVKHAHTDVVQAAVDRSDQLQNVLLDILQNIESTR